jgi:riboflavin biosynthesis pyrimidine reductase
LARIVDALQLVFEEPPAAAGSLPPEVAALYGGALSLPDDVLYCNFVSSLDGVVALDAPGAGAGPTISGRSPADRLVMGILRALAEVVVVGAGTLRADSGHLWTPAYIYPPLADAFARLGEPRLAVVTASGEIDPSERALQPDGLILTTDAGEAWLRGKLTGGTRVRSLGSGPLGGRRILEALRAEGHRRILTEGGPHLMARFLEEALLDSLFLTLSPVLAGRSAGDGRLGLLEGLELLPARPEWWRLASVRRHRSHLFLRYDRTR